MLKVSNCKVLQLRLRQEKKENQEIRYIQRKSIHAQTENFASLPAVSPNNRGEREEQVIITAGIRTEFYTQ